MPFFLTWGWKWCRCRSDGQVGDKRDRDWLRCPPPLALLLIPEHASGRGRERGPRMHACKHRPTAWGHHAISGKEGEERGSKGILSLLPPSPMRERKGSFPVPVVVPLSCNCVIFAAYSRVGHLAERRACEQKCKGSNAVCWMRRERNERVGCVRLTYARIRVSLSPPQSK